MADAQIAGGTNRFLQCASAHSTRPYSMRMDKTHAQKLNHGTALMKAIVAEDATATAALCKIGACGLSFILSFFFLLFLLPPLELFLFLYSFVSGGKALLSMVFLFYCYRISETSASSSLPKPSTQNSGIFFSIA